MQRYKVTAEYPGYKTVASARGEWVRFKDADTELAKLKEDLRKAHQDGYAEGRKHRVAAAETHADEMHRAQEEIAKLRAELDEWKAKAHSLNSDRAAARDAVFTEGLARIEAEKQLVAVRSALAAETEALSEYRRDHADDECRNDARPQGGMPDPRRVLCRKLDARRAAEAKARADAKKLEEARRLIANSEA